MAYPVGLDSSSMADIVICYRGHHGPGNPPRQTEKAKEELTMRRRMPSSRGSRKRHFTPSCSPSLHRLRALTSVDGAVGLGLSLLSSFDLPHFVNLPRLSPRADRSGRRDGRRAIEGSDIARSLPDRLGRIEFTCVTDGSFVSGCSPPFLMETQLPLSTSGR